MDRTPDTAICPLSSPELNPLWPPRQLARFRLGMRHEREALGLDESHSSRSIFKTLNEAELSESLVYLTCPICEEVLEKDPLFTPCHHTFCGACIRGRLREGEESCAECLAPLKEGDLQPNLMAAKLLSRMRSCCIYKAHGCSWKGRVSELSQHYRSCSYAAGPCPFGCGRNLTPASYASHVLSCELRTVA